MLTLGPTRGIFLNTVFYLPLVLWLIGAPFGRHFRGDRPPPRRAVRGLADILQTIREVRVLPVLAPMMALAGAASFFVGNSYQAQMPGFAHDLGHGDPGTAYTMLLAADATGALVAGVLLESRGGLFAIRPQSAMALAMGWGAALLGFALMRSYPLAIGFLLVAGFCELSFSSMTQTLVQMNAPEASRGRVLGLYNMAAAGLRAFSGITVGLAGSIVTVHGSLAVAAGGFIVVAGFLLTRVRAAASAAIGPAPASPF
jgi:MFS family permease